MNNVIRFQKRFRPAAPTADDPDIVHAKQQQRYAKWHQWKSEVRRYGGGHRKPDGMTNRDAIATIEVDKKEWRSLEYRQAMAAEVLKQLLAGGVIGIGVSRSGLYRFRKGVWEQLISDRMIKQCLVRHMNFVRDGTPLTPPRWLTEAMRFQAYEYMDQGDDD